jgi:hypothetical protein
MRLIDADELMEHVGRDKLDSREAIMEMVKNAPTIEPRPRGQWLPDNRNYYEERFVCSVCKRSYEVDTCMGDPTWDFCPGCGADMREEELDATD